MPNHEQLSPRPSKDLDKAIACETKPERVEESEIEREVRQKLREEIEKDDKAFNEWAEQQGPPPTGIDSYTWEGRWDGWEPYSWKVQRMETAIREEVTERRKRAIGRLDQQEGRLLGKLVNKILRRPRFGKSSD